MNGDVGVDICWIFSIYLPRSGSALSTSSSLILNCGHVWRMMYGRLMTEALQLPGTVFPSEATPAKVFAVMVLLMSFGLKCPTKAK